MRDGSLATVRATILRASGWPAEEDGLIKEYGGKGRENKIIRTQTQTHMNLFRVKNREKYITSDKVEYEFKFILVEVRWGDN